MGCIRASRTECPLAKRLARRVAGPCFGHRAQKREEHGAAREAHVAIRMARRAPARVYDQVRRREDGLDFREHEWALAPALDEPSRRKHEGPLRALDFRDESA